MRDLVKVTLDDGRLKAVLSRVSLRALHPAAAMDRAGEQIAALYRRAIEEERSPETDEPFHRSRRAPRRLSSIRTSVARSAPAPNGAGDAIRSDGAARSTSCRRRTCPATWSRTSFRASAQPASR